MWAKFPAVTSRWTFSFESTRIIAELFLTPFWSTCRRKVEESRISMTLDLHLNLGIKIKWRSINILIFCWVRKLTWKDWQKYKFSKIVDVSNLELPSNKTKLHRKTRMILINDQDFESVKTAKFFKCLTGNFKLKVRILEYFHLYFCHNALELS